MLTTKITVMPTRQNSISDPTQRVYGYLFSEKPQKAVADRDLRSQREAISAWAADNGFVIDAFVVERGFAPDFPSFSRVDVKKSVAASAAGDAIVASRFDRLFDAPAKAHATLTMAGERGVQIRALDAWDGKHDLARSPSLLNILLAVSSADPNYQKSVVARAVKQREAKEGRYRGGHPDFGATEDERRHIVDLRRMQNDGLSLRALARVSKEAGFNLSHAGIGKILGR